jgi:hypothetical protein
MENNSMRGFDGEMEYLANMPGNRLAFAVIVGGQNDILMRETGNGLTHFLDMVDFVGA